ncbi:MAG: pyridoxal-phosphate dependent enzyme [Myxococcota bacterium]|nr:pyridoxal-phosphate dependent enzyme [Myxococcota bacterium]
MRIEDDSPKRTGLLGHYPTPLEPWPQLGELLDCELWAKRDDLIGLAFGGNKTRKLDYLVQDALQQGADWLLTTGAPQSNHCRQSAAAAAKAGLGCTLLLGGPGIRSVTGNLLLNYVMGAEVEWTTTDMHEREDALQDVADRLRARGHTPSIIPLGGSNHLGTWAFVKAVEELSQQLDALGSSPPDIIITASSSGATQAGLVLGTQALGWNTRVLGISVDLPREPLQALVRQCIQSAQQAYPPLAGYPSNDLWIEDLMTEEEYAAFTAPELESLVEVARKGGVLLDPVYTGRAFLGARKLAEQTPRLFAGKRVLFWHTGGTPALFSYSRGLASYADTWTEEKS